MISVTIKHTFSIGHLSNVSLVVTRGLRNGWEGKGLVGIGEIDSLITTTHPGWAEKQCDVYLPSAPEK